MKSIISILLVVIGIAAVVYGFIDYQESKELLEIGELKLEAGGKDPSQSHLLYWIGGGVAIVAGILMRRGG